MEEIIKEQQKEIDLLNIRLDTARFIGKNNKIRIEEGLRIRTEIVNKLKALVI